jgi:hypothetical protein
MPVYPGTVDWHAGLLATGTVVRVNVRKSLQFPRTASGPYVIKLVPLDEQALNQRLPCAETKDDLGTGASPEIAPHSFLLTALQ